jgi:hypothetical protein
VAAALDVRTSIDAYVTGFNRQQHINFIGNPDGNVYELFYDGSWHYNDLGTLSQS